MLDWLDEDALGGERSAEIFPVYDKAWRVRKASGSLDAFAEELKKADIAGEIRSSGTLEHEFWFGAWNAGVKPSALGRWGLRFAASSMGTYAREGLRDLDDDPDWMKVPSEVRETGRVGGVEITSSSEKVVRVEVEVDPSGPELASQCLALEPSESGVRKVRIWIDARAAGRLPVMVGSSRLGWVVSSKPSKPALRVTRTWRGQVRVPSGTVKLIPDDSVHQFAVKKPAKVNVRR